jgi:hypothetical protein
VRFSAEPLSQLPQLPVCSPKGALKGCQVQPQAQQPVQATPQGPIAARQLDQQYKLSFQRQVSILRPGASGLKLLCRHLCMAPGLQCSARCRKSLMSHMAHQARIPWPKARNGY